jgi:hypothetical protein
MARPSSVFSGVDAAGGAEDAEGAEGKEGAEDAAATVSPFDGSLRQEAPKANKTTKNHGASVRGSMMKSFAFGGVRWTRSFALPWVGSR